MEGMEALDPAMLQWMQRNLIPGNACSYEVWDSALQVVPDLIQPQALSLTSGANNWKGVDVVTKFHRTDPTGAIVRGAPLFSIGTRKEPFEFFGIGHGCDDPEFRKKMKAAQTTLSFPDYMQYIAAFGVPKGKRDISIPVDPNSPMFKFFQRLDARGKEIFAQVSGYTRALQEFTSASEIAELSKTELDAAQRIHDKAVADGKTPVAPVDATLVATAAGDAAEVVRCKDALDKLSTYAPGNWSPSIKEGKNGKWYLSVHVEFDEVHEIFSATDKKAIEDKKAMIAMGQPVARKSDKPAARKFAAYKVTKWTEKDEPLNPVEEFQMIPYIQKITSKYTESGQRRYGMADICISGIGTRAAYGNGFRFMVKKLFVVPDEVSLVHFEPNSIQRVSADDSNAFMAALNKKRPRDEDNLKQEEQEAAAKSQAAAAANAAPSSDSVPEHAPTAEPTPVPEDKSVVEPPSNGVSENIETRPEAEVKENTAEPAPENQMAVDPPAETPNASEESAAAPIEPTSA